MNPGESLEFAGAQRDVKVEMPENDYAAVAADLEHGPNLYAVGGSTPFGQPECQLNGEGVYRDYLAVASTKFACKKQEPEL